MGQANTWPIYMVACMCAGWWKAQRQRGALISGIIPAFSDLHALCTHSSKITLLEASPIRLANSICALRDFLVNRSFQFRKLCKLSTYCPVFILKACARSCMRRNGWLSILSTTTRRGYQGIKKVNSGKTSARSSFSISMMSACFIRFCITRSAILFFSSRSTAGQKNAGSPKSSPIPTVFRTMARQMRAKILPKATPAMCATLKHWRSFL